MTPGLGFEGFEPLEPVDSASGYETFTGILGRGFRNVQRLDIALEKVSR